MKTQFKRRQRRRGGAVLVECAIALPILLAFFVFFWEFARAEQIRQTAATAAYEGARQGIVEGGTAADAERAARAILDAVNVREAQVVVTPSVITGDTTTVQVSITVPLRENAWMTPFFVQGLEITGDMKLTKY